MEANRLTQQMDFIVECDKLKLVQRRTQLLDRSRQENSAEHSWHLAVMALLLSEYASSEQLDLPRVIRMLLIHDLVEIDAGDFFPYDESSREEQAAQEHRAAERLFAILPSEQGQELRSLWGEFEARSTPEARFAVALDRLHPLLLTYHTEGAAWKKHGVTSEQVLRVNRHIAEGSPDLWDYAQELIHNSIAKGYLPE